MTSDVPQIKDELRREQIAENMRFFADMRFKQLTLLLAFQSLAAAGFAQYPKLEIWPNVKLKLLLAMMANFVTAVFWVMEVRSNLHFFANRDVAPELWPREESKCLGKIVSSSTVVVLLHLGMFAFWYACLWHWTDCDAILAGYALLGILLAIFTVAKYTPVMSKH